MNRIFELAKQADIIQWDSLPSGARTPDHESVVKAKKFAELIVRECMTTMLKESKWYWDKDEWESSSAIQSATRRVKEHFGVEE